MKAKQTTTSQSLRKGDVFTTWILDPNPRKVKLLFNGSSNRYTSLYSEVKEQNKDGVPTELGSGFYSSTQLFLNKQSALKYQLERAVETRKAAARVIANYRKSVADCDRKIKIIRSRLQKLSKGR